MVWVVDDLWCMDCVDDAVSSDWVYVDSVCRFGDCGPCAECPDWNSLTISVESHADGSDWGDLCVEKKSFHRDSSDS